MVTGAARAGRGRGPAPAVAGAIVHALDVLPEDDATWHALRAEAGARRRASAGTGGGRASEADWRALAAEIEREGAPLYGLVNNAA